MKSSPSILFYIFNQVGSRKTHSFHMVTTISVDENISALDSGSAVKFSGLAQAFDKAGHSIFLHELSLWSQGNLLFWLSN